MISSLASLVNVCGGLLSLREAGRLGLCWHVFLFVWQPSLLTDRRSAARMSASLPVPHLIVFFSQTYHMTVNFSGISSEYRGGGRGAQPRALGGPVGL